MRTLPYIDIHTHGKSDTKAISINSYSILQDEIPSERRIMVGVHPWSAGEEYSERVVEKLERISIVAIGEIGLDFSREVDRDKQTEWFEGQLRVAERRDIPVVIHCVRAFEEIMRLLKRYKIRRAVFHSFIGSRVQAQRVVDLGYYLSISPATLRSPRTLEAIRETSMESILIETDATTIEIETQYRRVAEALNITLEELKEKIYSNYIKLFQENIDDRELAREDRVATRS